MALQDTGVVRDRVVGLDSHDDPLLMPPAYHVHLFHPAQADLVHQGDLGHQVVQQDCRQPVKRKDIIKTRQF